MADVRRLPSRIGTDIVFAQGVRAELDILLAMRLLIFGMASPM
jgi:hypothetical protein